MPQLATAPFTGSEVNVRFALNCDWDINTLRWIKSTGSTGGGGAVTVADGADVALGSVSDAEWASGDGTAISLLKKIANPSGGGLTDAQLRATPVPVSGTVTSNAGTNLNTSLLALEAGGNLAGAATSLAVIDDWDETDRAKVNIIAGQIGVAGGTGVDAATVQRVSLATNVALPAGTNNIGDVDVLTLPSLVAGNANIGDVDVATIAAGDNNIGNVDIVTMPNVTLAAGTNTNEVVGDAAHDVAVAGNPLLGGGYASAAAPTDVGADGRVVREWRLRNGAAATVITAAGALVGGDAANGLDVDVTRLPALVAGNANIGDVDIASIAAGDNNIGNVDIVSGTVTTVSTVTSLTQMNGAAISMNTGVRDSGTQRVTIATNDAVPVTDNAGTLTVDAPIGTPVNVQIGNATLAAGVIDETGASAVDALAVGGGTAHDAVDSGNPVKIGGIARQANPTAVAALDRVSATFDDVGRQVSVIGQVRDLMVHQHTQIASSSAETTILAAAASTFHDLTQLIITNETATAVTATIKDATAGTTRMIIALAASGGAVIPFLRPLTQSATNGNWTATLSSAAVTVNFLVQAEKNV